MSDRKCADRIAGQLESRLEDAGRIMTAMREPDDTDDAYREHDEYPLWISASRVVRIDLSTGGPADWFEVHVSDDGEISRIVYHFADWFDHAEVTLEGADFERAADFLAPYVEIELCS